MMFRDYPVISIFTELRRDDLLPAILFRSARKQCDQDVQKLVRSKACELNTHEQLYLREQVAQIIKKYNVDKEIIYQHPQYAALIKTGAGAHHAGQLLIWRIVLEELMTRGAIKILIATGTVAAGVDFPARAVVITAHSRRGNEGYRFVQASELQQMSGRAGRRGRDAVGFCIVAPSIYADARVISEVSKKPPEPLKSAYFASPSTVLNLLRYRSVDDLKFTVAHSLGSFLDRKQANRMRQEFDALKDDLSSLGPDSAQYKKLEKRIRREERLAQELEDRQMTLLQKSLDGLTHLGHLAEGKLTEKGTWSAHLCTSLVLELAEAIDTGLFKDLGIVELVGLLASISGTQHKVYLGIKENPIDKKYLASMKEILEKVGAAYERPPSTAEIEVMPDAATTVLTWMESSTWAEFSGLLRLAGVAEGDVARLVSQTADHLHQLTRLSQVFPSLAATAEEARYRILKPPLSEVLAASDA